MISLPGTFLCTYLGSAFLAFLITPVVIRLANRIGAVDWPGVRAVHRQPVPRLGGVAVFLSALCLTVAVLFLANPLRRGSPAADLRLLILLPAAAFIFLIGLVDDLRGLPARVKFLAELLAAAVLCWVGFEVQSVSIGDDLVVYLGSASYLFTVLWMVGVTNAVNLSDGLDGLAAGVSAITCAGLAVFAIHSNHVMASVLLLALLGSLSGFLVFNFHPAKIFLGDCGSLSLGFTISALSVWCVARSGAFAALAIPALALAIPIFDTLFSMLRRFLDRRSLFAPDRSHFHHRLLDLGVPHRRAVLLIYLATLVTAGMSLLVIGRGTRPSLVLVGGVLLLIVLLFRVVGAIRLRETLVRLRIRRAHSRQEQQDRRIFEDLQLRFRQVRDAAQWRQAVCDAARHMDFAWVSLTTTYPDGRVEQELWRGPQVNPDPLQTITMTIPLPRLAADLSRQLEIAIHANGSIEAANRRATLFGRLLDEHRTVMDSLL
jgi:UDP-GlcNAc:undecaprenyl-phosphate GlcNAc-1-phosphate transferase